MRIPLSSPDVTEDDIAAVVEVLRTPRLSVGPKLERFEEAVASYIGTPHAVAVSSGTAGLHLALAALGIGEGDEVILPSFTFIAAANAVLYRRARPVFVDIDPHTLNLTPEAVERAITSRTRAIIAVHTFGYPADLGPILEIAARRGVRVVEDACEALGAECLGKKAGALGDFGVFGFYPNKPITTGEGGMLVTGDRRLAGTVRALRNQGRRADDGWLDHSLLGYNYRISELNCALGLSQMSRIDAILARREDRAACYGERLQAIPDLILPPFEAPHGRVCWFTFVVRLADSFTRESRDRVLAFLAARGIGCAPYFAPIHRQPLYAPYAGAGCDFAVTESVAQRTLALPFFNRLTDAEIGDVCGALREAIESVQSRRSK
jgi:perosamine synthetase